MEHSSIDLETEQVAAQRSRPLPPVLAWIMSLALFQPIGFVVAMGIVGGAIGASAFGGVIAALVGLALVFWIGRGARGNVRPLEAKQLRR